MASFWDTGGGEDFGAKLYSAWDIFKVAGKALPGVASVEGEKRYKIDKREAPGTDGATLTNLGLDTTEVTVRVRMWTADQFTRWCDNVVPLLQPGKPGTKPKALRVFHPALAAAGISSLYPMSVGLPVVRSEIAEVVIKFVQFLPPNKSGVKTVKAAIDTSIPSALKPAAKPTPSKSGVGP